MTRMDVLEMKQVGLSYKEIGQKMGCTRQRVHQLIKTKHGLSGTCSICKNYTELLHDHHVSYVPEVKQLVCIPCHMSLHKGSRLLKKARRANLPRTTTSVGLARLLGWKLHSVHGITHELTEIHFVKHGTTPYNELNWTLPNALLVSIWDISEIAICRFRKQFSHGARLVVTGQQYRWMLRRNSVPEDILQMISKEKEKRAFWEQHWYLPQNYGH